jgi:hypothetical protein
VRIVARPDETKIVDRDSEVAVFAGMLNGPRRVLTVSDKPGMGKSDLLRKLRFVCEFRHDVPVALVDMQDFQNRPEEFAIIEKLVGDLSHNDPPGQPSFPVFNRLNKARIFQDRNSFYEQAIDVRGQIDLQEANVSGGTIGGVIFQVEHAGTVALPTWPAEAERAARELCVTAFFTDLLAAARERPMVILIDTVDSAGDTLLRWLFLDFLRKGLLANWADHRLVVVLAGKGVHQLLEPRLLEDHRPHVEPLSMSTDWTVEQVEEFLRVHGFGERIPALSPGDVDLVRRAVLGGHPLTKVLAIAEQYASPDP